MYDIKPSQAVLPAKGSVLSCDGIKKGVIGAMKKIKLYIK